MFCHLVSLGTMMAAMARSLELGCSLNIDCLVDQKSRADPDFFRKLQGKWCFSFCGRGEDRFRNILAYLDIRVTHCTSGRHSFCSGQRPKKHQYMDLLIYLFRCVLWYILLLFGPSKNLGNPHRRDIMSRALICPMGGHASLCRAAGAKAHRLQSGCPVTPVGFQSWDDWPRWFLCLLGWVKTLLKPPTRNYHFPSNCPSDCSSNCPSSCPPKGVLPSIYTKPMRMAWWKNSGTILDDWNLMKNGMQHRFQLVQDFIQNLILGWASIRWCDILDQPSLCS